MDASDLTLEVKLLMLKVRDQEQSIAALSRLVKELLDSKYQHDTKQLEQLIPGVRL